MLDKPGIGGVARVVVRRYRKVAGSSQVDASLFGSPNKAKGSSPAVSKVSSSTILAPSEQLLGWCLVVDMSSPVEASDF